MASPPPSVLMPWSTSCLCIALLLLTWLDHTWAMRPDRIASLRDDTVEMFYHGYDNYMRLAFPDDEVSCTPPLCLVSELRADSMSHSFDLSRAPLWSETI